MAPRGSPRYARHPVEARAGLEDTLVKPCRRILEPKAPAQAGGLPPAQPGPRRPLQAEQQG
ncbi:hypothetical protein CF15_08405 [Pyrodictium occultum]|uniref:Uncharacterized protein n=1 Tax=Pyrodictium occultum TaxID=2309 RepID=A0A0V8RS53_PYROC|nr:hypothetical protein CF15_08405 [Pyrodictium occultum]